MGMYEDIKRYIFLGGLGCPRTRDALSGRPTVRLTVDGCVCCEPPTSRKTWVGTVLARNFAAKRAEKSIRISGRE